MSNETTTNITADHTRQYECMACSWRGLGYQLLPLSDPNGLLWAGDIYPAGECPKCKAPVRSDADVDSNTIDIVTHTMVERGYAKPFNAQLQVALTQCDKLVKQLAAKAVSADEGLVDAETLLASLQSLLAQSTGSDRSLPLFYTNPVQAPAPPVLDLGDLPF